MDYQEILKRFRDAETVKQKYMPLWRDIAKYTGIKVDVDDTKEEGDNIDTYTLDPTTSLSSIQSADYLKGIIIGTGQKGVNIIPSDEVLEYTDISAVKDWFLYCSNILLKEFNHPNSGFHGSFSSYFYDQTSFGNSGIGVFKNELKNNASANALIFKAYGVDTMSIEEGKNGVADVIFNTYKWKTSQFVSEFCHRNGEFDKEMYERLPAEVRSSYENNDFNKTYVVVAAVFPNELYNPEKVGKSGAKYLGCWFMPDSKDGIFFEESFKERPISFGRPIKVRGEVYGRAYGTMLLSSIRCVNDIVNGLMITLEKMRDPAIGVWGDAINGDTVIDTSSGSVTAFDPTKLSGNTPLFKLQDVGDPTAIINFLLPYLNEKLATAFKIDLLLDFSQASNMTATESLQRYSIRNKSILGLIMQQINDVYIPTIDRAISILWDMGRFGVSTLDAERVQALKNVGTTDRIIPEAVERCIKEGKPWYKIQFNNEIEKISNTDKIDNLVQMLQIAQGLMSFNPELIHAVDWYKLLEEMTGSLGFETAVLSKKDFENKIKEIATQNQMAQQMQLENLQSQTNKNNANSIRDLENGLSRI